MAKKPQNNSSKVLKLVTEKEGSFTPPAHFDLDMAQLYDSLAKEIKGLRGAVMQSDLAALENVVETSEVVRLARENARKALAGGDLTAYEKHSAMALRHSRGFSAGLSSLGLTAHDRDMKRKRKIAAEQGTTGRSPLWGDRLHRKLRKD